MLGVDLLATGRPGRRRGAPAPGARPGARRRRRDPGPRAAAFRDAAAAPGHPRWPAAGPGWAALCRLVSATHLAGERGRPVADLALPGSPSTSRGGDVLVLLGPGLRAGAARRPGAATTSARAALAPWRELVPAENLLVELVSHRLPGTARRLGAGHRRRTPPGWPALARQAGPAGGAHQRRPLRRPARRPDRRRPRRRPAAGRPRPAPRRPGQRRGLPQVRQADGRGRRGDLPARRAWPTTARRGPAAARPHPRGGRPVRARPPRRPRPGGGALPRASSSLAGTARRTPGRAPPTRCSGPAARRRIGRRYGSAPRQRIWKRLDDELRDHPRARLRLLLPHRRRRHRPDPRAGRALRGPRLGRRQPGQLPARHLRGRPDPPRPADGAVPLPAARRRCPTSTSTWSPPAGSRSTSGSSTATAGSAASRVSMMDTYRVRHAVRDVGAALGMPPGEIDAIAKAFPHIRARDARMALRELPELRACGPRRRSGSTCCSGSSSGSTGCPATSRCTRAGCCSPTPPCSTAPRSRPASPASR